MYRNDGTGRLRFARHFVRYSYENQRSDALPRRLVAERRYAAPCCVDERNMSSLARAPSDAAQRRMDGRPEASDAWSDASGEWPGANDEQPEANGQRSKASDRLHSIRVRAARVRDRIRRLQSFPQYRCDPEMQVWVRLYMQLEGMLGHVSR